MATALTPAALLSDLLPHALGGLAPYAVGGIILIFLLLRKPTPKSKRRDVDNETDYDRFLAGEQDVSLDRFEH